MVKCLNIRVHGTCRRTNLTTFIQIYEYKKAKSLFDLTKVVGWLVGFGFNGPLNQYFKLYRAVFQREREKEERMDR